MPETWLPPLLNHVWMFTVVCTKLQGSHTFGILFNGFIEFIWFPSISNYQLAHVLALHLLLGTTIYCVNLFMW